MKTLVLTIALLTGTIAARADEPNAAFMPGKVRGMLTGTLFGDALGGPIEFHSHEDIQKTPKPPKLWRAGEVLNGDERRKAAARIWLRPYKPLRPVPEPYAHWSYDAAPGTVTDDSRHKMILIGMLRSAAQKQSWPVSSKVMAQTYLDWHLSKSVTDRPTYSQLTDEWLDETYRAARWHLGERDLKKAYPTERLWNALPTCYGQMALTPLAALYPGQPEAAYRAAYQVAFFDNGWGRDMNAALVAGLSVALTIDIHQVGKEKAWAMIFAAMRNTDPYGYNNIPWTPRSVTLWLDNVDQFVAGAHKQPARLFEILDRRFKNDIKWEAQVPFTVIFSVLKIADYDPLAALELSIEWGNDHDSYAQLLGAFVGALYGEELLTPAWRQTIATRLMADYGENIDEWADTLQRIAATARTESLFQFE